MRAGPRQLLLHEGVQCRDVFLAIFSLGDARLIGDDKNEFALVVEFLDHVDRAERAI